MPTTLDQLAAQEIPTVVVLWLLTILHPDLPTPIYMVKDRVPLISRGNTYIPYPQMSVGLPESQQDRPPVVQVVLEDVDRTIVDALRRLAPDQAPSLLVELVLSDDVNTVQRHIQAPLRDATYDRQTITGQLWTDPLIARRAPALM